LKWFTLKETRTRELWNWKLLNKLQQILSTLEPEGPQDVSKNGVSFVSIEDAMKELLDMGVKT
jgi:hypothetical protein